MKKAIYLIGGGPMAVNTFTWAKELGLKTVVTDINPEAPGIKLADFHAVISASDTSGNHESFIDTLSDHVQICGVYCGNEIGAPTANKLLKYIGLPFVDSNSMKIAADKGLMKKEWQRHQICTPTSILLESPRHLSEILKLRESTFIVKPTLGSGSRGVQIVRHGVDVNEVWGKAYQPVNYKGQLIIESFKAGRSIDANGIFFNNTYYAAGILEKYITKAPECLPLGGNNPVNLGDEVGDKIHKLMEDACRAIKLTEGPVKGDFILTKEGIPYLLEVAPRLHGDVTSCNTLPFGSGINPLKFMFKYWSQRQIDEQLLNENRQGYGAWRVLCLPPGYSYHKLNSNVIEQNDEILMSWFNKRHDRHLKSYINTQQIPGYISAYGKNKAEVEAKMKGYCRKINIDRSFKSSNLWYKDLKETLLDLQIDPESCGYQSELI